MIALEPQARWGMLDPTEPLVEHAVAYGRDGLRVFPVNPDPDRAKVPLIKAYHQSASTDEATIRAWWGRWPTALIGHAIDDDVVILDVDPRHGGDTTWAALDLDGAVDGVLQHRSGRGDGGAHHWFQRPDGDLSVTRLHEWARERGVGAPNVDLATGEFRSWSSGIDLLTSGHRYTILPPSPHPETGKPYRWQRLGLPGPIPEHLRALLVEPAGGPAPIREPQRQPIRLPSSGGPTFDPGHDSPADWYTDHRRWEDVLGPRGWRLVHGDGDSDGSLWRHPSATQDHSASVRHGLLFCFSPNAGLPVSGEGGTNGLTRFRAYAHLHHGGDESEAAGHVRRTMMPQRPDARPRQPVRPPERPLEGPRIDAGAPEALTVPEVPIPALPEDFWTERDWLRVVRQAAWHRVTPADAVLGAVLARIAAIIHPCYVLPAIVGSTATFDHMSVLVGRSSSGKSTAAAIARELVPERFQQTIRWDWPTPSGEGLVEAYFDMVDVEQDNGKSKPEKRLVYQAVHFTVDEGLALVEASQGRQGTTIGSVLCSAWSGSTIGQGNASIERRRIIPAGRVRMAGLVGIQADLGHRLCADTWVQQGLTGRLTFYAAEDRLIPDLDHLPGWPGPLDVPTLHVVQGMTVPFEVAPAIVREIREARHAVATGRLVEAAIDGHTRLARLKIAGLLAAAEGRTSITTDDWRLAGVVVGVSTAIRDRMVAIGQEQQAWAARLRAERDALREVRQADHAHHLRVERIARRIGSKVQAGEWSTWSEARRGTKHGPDREAFEDAVERASVAGWIVVHEVDVTDVTRRTFSPGTVRA